MATATQKIPAREEPAVEQPPRPSDQLRLAEAAAYLAISRQTLYRLIRSKQLRVTRLMRTRRISRRECDRLIDRRTRSEG